MSEFFKMDFVRPQRD